MRPHLAQRLGVGVSVGVLTLTLSGCAAVAGVGDPPTATIGAAVDSARAQSIAAQVLSTASKAAATPGADGDALRETAYTADALVAAKADAKLDPTRDQAAKDAKALTAAAPVVLAVSRGLDYPRSMIVQTTRAATGLPVLSYLVTPDVRTPYRIAAMTPMLPSASVKAFDPLTQGSKPLGDSAGLAAKPEELAKLYAAALAYPAPAAGASAPFAEDSFAAAVRKNADAQNQGLGGVGSFTQQHQPKDVIGGLRAAGGKGALVFVVLDRKDTLLNKNQGTLTPSPQFSALSGLSTVTAEAILQTYEFVAFAIPDQGPAVVVGADEHLVAASGT